MRACLIALHWGLMILLLNCVTPVSHAFQTCFAARRVSLSRRDNALYMGYYSRANKGRSSPRSGADRSKRQERVGHVVRTQLSTILHRGNIKGDADYLDAELRQRISVVNADVSPDLRQARITVSIRKGIDNGDSNSNPPAVDKRRAYSWLVRNTKPIRHTLAQQLSHMKSVPNLSFVQADVAAAVDVMYLIDKVSSGYKREKIGAFGDDDTLPEGMVKGIDFDDVDDDDDWVDIDENDELYQDDPLDVEGE